MTVGRLRGSQGRQRGCAKRSQCRRHAQGGAYSYGRHPGRAWCAVRSHMSLSRFGTWVAVYPPAAELADDVMRDFIYAWAASMVEDKRAVVVEAKGCQDATELPPLRQR